jgi:subtilisin family serine protease
MLSRPPLSAVVVGGLLAFLVAALLAAASASAAAPADDSYIVMLKQGEDSSAVANEHHDRHGAVLEHIYGHAFDGYAARIPAGKLDAIRSDPRVAQVEKDAEVTTMTTEPFATWGLDRIDQRTLPLNGTFTYNATGTGVTAYIVDTGIDVGNSDFGGRASWGVDEVDGKQQDCNGHGTHVAGTVGGSTWGVAKGVSLVAVRVMDCNGSGTYSSVIAGLDWVADNHTQGAPAVVNMSLGGPVSAAVDAAVNRVIADGVTVAVAAGNGTKGGVAEDACKFSPSRVPDALTTSATDQTDAKASWANYGSCVDWFAPGVGITSDWLGGTTSTLSGTSMASPHTAGVAALYLQGNPTASPAQVASALAGVTTKSVVKSSNTTAANLLYTAF